ncbi:hypothetical protein SBE55_23865 [Mycolicibacterium sp. 141076]|uniref:hypothetical protein n=2 Tax=Mycobacteriaceae TaxID=1762 RepID=UPI00299D363B|nr:hypothetical protein [Mycolicibacterium sp. 141076]MDX1880851.1 hypothetical protein [Mycolicibacterium sp. 141076]
MFGQPTPVGTEGLPLTGKVRPGGRHDDVRALPTTERGTMILVGAVLLALGLIFNIYPLWVAGVVVLVVGAVFWLLGATGRPIAGRRYWY